MSSSGPGSKDSITEVAEEESFVRERPPDIERGSVLAGRYQIEDIIGKGGSGIVLRVFDRTAQNLVALKVLKGELARDAKWEKRFSRELRLGRPIQHRNVCRIFDIGEADGHRFLTMELARGGSLRDELKGRPALERPIADRLSDARAAIEGLAAIHGAGVVHRDLKPDNLLRMEDGRLVISDFGLATDAANAPGATVLIGTPHYMAPEVLAGEPATSRSDVWALGVVLHEIFFGRRPERRPVSFDGSDRSPLRLPSPIERSMLSLCQECLADGPRDRPADAGIVAQQFTAALTTKGGVKRSRRSTLTISACAGLAVLAGLVVVARNHSRARKPAPVPTASGVPLQPTGQGVDWGKATRVVADVAGRVHCFSMLNRSTARLVWGAPRRAEDVDLLSGHRAPSTLDPESYRVGCPELSPSGRALLFVGTNQAGAAEIRLSNAPDGRSARTITSGSEPQWTGGDDDDFIYEVDSSHVARYSLPTMSFSLLGDPGFGKHRAVVDKAVDRLTGTIALLLCDESSNYAVAVYEGKELELAKTIGVPAVHRIQFGWNNGALLVSYQLSGAVSTLGLLSWRESTLRNLGRYPGFDIVRARLSGAAGVEGDVLVARHVSSDLWYDDGTRRQKLTNDGQNYSGDRSSSGDVLVSKWNRDGSVNIWLESPGGEATQLTHGQSDVEPRFSPAGHEWAYADYAKKSVMLCSFDTHSCRVLREDELPSSPAFSPDGRNLAYLAQLGAQRLKIVSTVDGSVRASWDAYSQCAPVWASSSKLWSLATSGGHYTWWERDIATGARTGNRLDVENKGDDASVEIQCPFPRDAPFYRHVRAERKEVSRLLYLQ
jgi:serine/threonine protein kinase